MFADVFGRRFQLGYTCYVDLLERLEIGIGIELPDCVEILVGLEKVVAPSTLDAY